MAAMFQDVCIGHTGFRSKHVKHRVDAVCSTVPLRWNDSDVQTVSESADGDTQTDATVSSTGKNKPNAADSEAENVEKTRDFLARVGPLMLEEISKSATQSALFSSFERYLEATNDTDIIKLHSLTFDYDAYFKAPAAAAPPPQPPSSKTKRYDEEDEDSGGNQPKSLRLSCTGVSWNATGAMIAVAYGRFDHSGWCNYRSALCLWRVFQSDLDPAKPHVVLETASGLMSVAFHPKNPSLVAAGSFSGEVLLWDLKTDDYRFFSSGIGEYFHCEPVTQVTWVYDVTETEYNIVSVSGDGKILYWRLKDKLAYPTEGYTLQLASTSTSSNTSASHTKRDAGRSLVAGGKAIAFSEIEKPSRAFIVGSEGGLIARCNARNSLQRANDMKKWTMAAARLVNGLPLPLLTTVRRQVEKHATEKQVKGISLATVYEAKVDPAILYPSASDFVFASHGGPVYGLSFSPFCRGVFLSSSSDGTVRVYKSREREPLLTIEVTPTSSYLYAVSWSRTRPMVFATAAEDGNVYVYDLRVDRMGPVATLNASTGDAATAIPGPASVAKGVTTSTSSSVGATKTKGFVAAVSPSRPAMFTLDFNPRQRNFLAAGDAKGVTHIWKLSWQLAALQSGEVSLLEALEDRA